MLAYFSVHNFRSINETLELNLQAAPRLQRHSSHVVEGFNRRILRAGLLYGANASGKSNIIKAISYAQNLINEVPTKEQKLLKEPFKLTQSIKKDSTFYFEFISDEKVFAYGFKIGVNRILEESLYDITKKEICLFERIYNDGYTYNTDIKLEKEKENELNVLFKYTSENNLFLAEAQSKDFIKKIPEVGKSIFPAILFFKYQLVTIYPNSYYSGIKSDLSSEETAESYADILKDFDTAVNKISLEQVPLIDFPTELISDIEEQLEDSSVEFVSVMGENNQEFSFEKQDDTLIAYKKVSQHKLKDGSIYNFNICEESDGTQRLLDLIPVLSDAESPVNRVFVIDEFDRSLHPNLSKAFIQMFLNSKKGNKNNQLIVTTHESGLLDNEILRRDEIWFVQKEHDQATYLYSLNDYSPRFDKDIRTAYLSGKFGAVPFIMSDYNKES